MNPEDIDEYLRCDTIATSYFIRSGFKCSHCGTDIERVIDGYNGYVYSVIDADHGLKPEIPVIWYPHHNCKKHWAQLKLRPEIEE